MDFYRLGKQAALEKFAIGKRQLARIDTALKRTKDETPGMGIDHRALVAQSEGGWDKIHDQEMFTPGPRNPVQPDPKKALRWNSGAREMRAERLSRQTPAISPTEINNRRFDADIFARRTQLTPAAGAAERALAQRTALSGRHGKTTTKIDGPPGMETPTPEAVAAVAKHPGVNPEVYSYKGGPLGGEKYFPDNRARWVSGSPVVSAGYGPRINAYKLPTSAPRSDVGPWTKHTAVDTRHEDPPLVDSRSAGRSNMGEFPYYERVVSHAQLAPNLAASYKRLPMSSDTYQQTRGKENPLANPSTLKEPL